VARCRCEQADCSCRVIAGAGINIAGTGQTNQPWVISSTNNCVDCSAGGNPGDVLTLGPDGTYAPQPVPGLGGCVDCATPPQAGWVLTWNSTAAAYQPAPAATGATGPPGPTGPAGPQGPPGESVQIVGSVPNSGGLTGVSNPTEGDGWITADTGHLWVFTGPAPNDSITKWTDVGQIVGPPGPAGQRGSLWYTGTTPPSPTISGVLPNDQYLDVVTGDVYSYAA